MTRKDKNEFFLYDNIQYDTQTTSALDAKPDGKFSVFQKKAIPITTHHTHKKVPIASL